MAIRGRNLDELTDVREVRQAHAKWDIRSDRQSGSIRLTGYASTFEPYEMYGGPAGDGWIEQLDRHAFDKTLREKPDLHLLINHDGMPLARTKSGTLELSVDSGGLYVEADLDRSDPDVQRLEAKMRRGDMDEMSFAFRVKAHTWSATDDFPNDSQAHRLITEVSLHKGDVSVVNFGANPTTTAEITGRRRKKGKTMTRAEALAMAAADRKKIDAVRPRSGGARSSTGNRITRTEAERISRSDRVMADAGALVIDLIEARVNELLTGRRSSSSRSSSIRYQGEDLEALKEAEMQRRKNFDAQFRRLQQQKFDSGHMGRCAEPIKPDTGGGWTMPSQADQ